MSEGGESYLEDEESEEEDWEGSSSSFQDYYKETTGGIISFVSVIATVLKINCPKTSKSIERKICRMCKGGQRRSMGHIQYIGLVALGVYSPFLRLTERVLLPCLLESGMV